MDKIDNTSPTIVNANVHNNKLNVVANDVKQGLGEGSGVVKYRYITSSEKIANPSVDITAKEVRKDEEFIIENIDNVKYVYVVAEDKVGNMSDVYEVEIPQLVLTSKVNLNIANGKGGVELDWSGYDIVDKYFVIYRKEENETDWKTVVGIEDRLCVSSYTDNAGNDRSNPKIPSSSINGDFDSNSISIDITSQDNGTNYVYYIEAYDSSDISKILAVSNVSEYNINMKNASL